MTNDQYIKLCHRFILQAAAVSAQADNDEQAERFIRAVCVILACSLLPPNDNKSIEPLTTKIKAKAFEALHEATSNDIGGDNVESAKKEPSAGSETTQETSSPQTGDTTSGGDG